MAKSDKPQTAPELSPQALKAIKKTKAAAPKPAAKAVPESVDETPAETSAAETAPQPALSDTTIIDDPATDQAVADIVIREGDTQLAVEDAIAQRKAGEVEEPGSSVSGFWVLLFLIIVAGTAVVVYLWFR